MSTGKGVRLELLFVGNELLIGEVLNTNSQWLARNITLLGGTCHRMMVVRDSLGEISNAVKEILARNPRFLIISGGLGPTYDDMTLEGLSIALGKPLRINKTAVSWVSKKYEELRKIGRVTDSKMSPPRRKMTRLPISSKPLPNPVGSAPGVFLEEKNTKIFCLPGVPKELKAIFRESVKKEIVNEVGERYFAESHFLVAGIGESTMAPAIEKVMTKYSPYVYIKSHPKLGKDVSVVFHLTTPDNPECYSVGIDFLALRIKEAQEELEDRIRKLGGTIVHVR